MVESSVSVPTNPSIKRSGDNLDPRARASPDTLPHLLVLKYSERLPLYRQSKIYAREGIELDRSTLGDWVGYVSFPRKLFSLASSRP
jgi:transposase